jgi:probable F420-dependent oxidoreductase
MRFALGIPMMHRGEDHAFLDGEAIAELAQAAEDAGWDALTITEHPIPGDKWLSAGGHHSLDPFVALAFAAAVTTRLRFITNLAVVPYRNPFLLAKSVATLDRLSGGRLTLGAGTGYLKPEYFALGVDFDERNELFDESLEVMRRTWTGEVVDHEGRHFNARGVRALPRPAQDPVPIWIGGNSRLTRRRVAERAQGWMPMPNPPAMARTTRTPELSTNADLAEMLVHLREHAAAVGRTEPIDVMFMSSAGGAPGTSDFDPRARIDDLAEQAELGVTWHSVNGHEGSRQEAFDAMAAFADTVIAKFR